MANIPMPYERKMASNPVRRGPLRFEEGVATDTDIPTEFGKGCYGDTPPDQRSHQWAMKAPAETMRERAHLGSAAWVEAPEHLSEFVQGAFSNHTTFERVQGSETRLRHSEPTVVGGL